jgi:hypothetical protein
MKALVLMVHIIRLGCVGQEGICNSSSIDCLLFTSQASKCLLFIYLTPTQPSITKQCCGDVNSLSLIDCPGEIGSIFVDVFHDVISFTVNHMRQVRAGIVEI